MTHQDALCLENRNILITGAGRRLGKALAEVFADRGANIAVHYHTSRSGAEAVVRHAHDLGRQAVAIEADLTNPADVTTLFDHAVTTLGSVNVLVNSASIFEQLSPLETDLNDWERHMAINVTAPFLLSKQLAVHLADGHGSILNILDWRAFIPDPVYFPYCISKSSLGAMTRNLAKSFAPNIRVNGLALGAILPPPTGKWRESAVLKKIPMGRLGTVEEVVEAALFLCAGPESITGEILHLDGGRHLG
jgi:pteridine reductase